jgi:hypothetical protein
MENDLVSEGGVPIERGKRSITIGESLAGSTAFFHTNKLQFKMFGTPDSGHY